MSDIIVQGSIEDTEYNEQIRAIFSDCISAFPNTEDMKKNTEMVIDLYKNHFAPSLPSLSNLVESIIEDQFCACYEASMLDMQSFYPEVKDEDEYDDCLSSISCEWETEAVDSQYDLECLILGILRQTKAACCLSRHGEFYHEIHADKVLGGINDVSLIINDCQNLLFSEFLKNGIAAYGNGFANYYGPIDEERVQDMIFKGNTLLLMGGMYSG